MNEAFTAAASGLLTLAIIYFDFWIGRYHQQGKDTPIFVKAHAVKHAFWVLGLAFLFYAGTTDSIDPLAWVGTVAYVMSAQAIALMIIKRERRRRAARGASRFKEVFETNQGMKF